MNNSTLNTLLKEYEKKKFNADLEFEKAKDSFYEKHPDLLSINNKLSMLALDISKSVLNGDNEKVKLLRQDFENLKLEKEKLLNTITIPENAKNPIYECNFCNDTGYILENGKTVLCNCIKQKLFDLEFNKSNLGNLAVENFDNFDLSLYSDEINEKKFSAKISPRQNIINIKNIVMKFIENFDDPTCKNLLFLGNTGLGKTFLSNCIAKEILEKNKTVLYQTAPIMLDSIIDYRFGKSDLKEIYDNIITVDLLVIDDLGAESLNSVKISEIFNVINARLLNQNNKPTKTIISTNLSMNNLFDTYGERIFSRIASYYDVCRFFGDDIRISSIINK